MTSSPLSGTLVVDLSRHLPGPLAAHLLADLGARVVKVEEPRMGDPVRLAPPLAGNGADTGVKSRSTLAALLLSGVESVALDLKRPAGREVLEGLLEGADVLLETFRPGTLARLGLDPEELRRRFPRLVVCSLSGWGQDGPYAPRAGHDLTYQALAGTLAATASMPAYPAADVTGAWSAVSSVLAALFARERTGEGTRIDASLFDAAVHLNLVGWAEEGAAGSGEAPAVGEPHGLAGALPCYRLYRTADGGWLAVAPLEEHFWQRFCEAAGRPDLRKLQYREDGKTHRKVARMVARRTLAEWRELLAGVDLPVEAVLPADEAARHPQTAARGVLKRGADGLFRLGFPARIGGGRPRAGEAYPELGEHTDRIVEEVGGRVAELPPARRRREGVGRRFSLRRALTRWALSRRR
ncbi:MAG: CaiB/BaiF CoA transferase family protein [Thermoanaerobaculia bacterium]